MQQRRKTKRPFLIFLALLGVVVVGGVSWLATLEIPVKQERIEKDLPADRFLKKPDARA